MYNTKQVIKGIEIWPQLTIFLSPEFFEAIDDCIYWQLSFLVKQLIMNI